MPWDPTLYQGSAPHYARGRPPYSPALAPTLARELGLDGRGRLLDGGCGPGIVALRLAPLFAETIGLDPDPDMLAQGEQRAREAGVASVRWVRGLAEEIPALGLGTFRLVTFAQSFHRTDRERVAEAVYDLLAPDGALALISHEQDGRTEPPALDLPRLPHAAIDALIVRFLGPRRRNGQGFARMPPDRFEDALRRTRFGAPRVVWCPGAADFVQDAEGAVADVLSRAYAAPHLFGERLDAFVTELRTVLADASPSGRFWEWPGDTQVLIATKPGEEVRLG